MSTFDDVRAICLAMPDTDESTWFGTPSFKVKGKSFCRLRDEDGLLVVFVSGLDEKEALLAENPRKFRTTPHYDGYPTVLLHLPSIGKRELAELLVESWRLKAPKRVLNAYEAAGSPLPLP